MAKNGWVEKVPPAREPLFTDRVCGLRGGRYQDTESVGFEVRPVVMVLRGGVKSHSGLMGLTRGLDVVAIAGRCTVADDVRPRNLSALQSLGVCLELDGVQNVK